MMYTMATGNQRKTIRFKPVKNAFASLGSKLNQVGKLVDISLGGLSFEFISDETPPEGKLHVDIFTLDESYSLSGLPCKIAYQSVSTLPGAKDGDTENFRIRRCGLTFNSLQIEHWCKVAYFIENNTSPEDLFAQNSHPFDIDSGDK
ncbi:MAG: PilZ domain-containing protein [Pseudomonadota bacterium]